MSWATVVVLDMRSTRAVHRAEKSADAVKWAEDTGLKDYIVVQAGYKASAFSDYELDALMTQFGDSRLGLKKDEKEKVVMANLARYDAKLHDSNGAAQPGAYEPPAVTNSGGTGSTRKENEVAKAKKAPAKAAPKKTGSKTVKIDVKVPKSRKKVQEVGDGLGREGTPARFIREKYLANQTTAQILEAVKKAFPKNDIKGPGYVSWYFNDMKKRGMVAKGAEPGELKKKA